MTKFAGIAIAALIVHAGAAFAQPVMIPDEGPRGRAGGDLRAPGQMEREGPARRPEGSPRAQRGQQGDEIRAQEAPSQPRERSQAQRERSGPSDEPRASEPQRAQGQQREKAQQEREQAQRDRDQAQRLREQAQRERPAESPERRERRSEPGQPAGQTAQPPRTDNRPAAPATARPAQPAPDSNQAPGSSAQRQAPAQPGTSTGATDAQTPQSRQSAGTQQPDAESQRIADTVRERVERQQIKPVSDFGVSVQVGAELPSRVQLQAVPREIAAIRPHYRDFRYTVSEREIVIVDPRSRRVVEVIARDGGRGHDVYAVFEQRRDVRRWSRPSDIVFARGTVLPASAPYYDLPPEIIEQHPDWRGYRYVMTESEEVAIVEPRSHRIVEVVGKGGGQSASTGSLARQPVSGDGGDRHEIVRMILADARPGELNGIDALKGATLPQGLKTQPIPAEAVDRDPGLKGYQYALIGDDVLVVDPGSRQIIDVIE